MDRLWAPWRMEYIKEAPRPGCLFCRVIEETGDADGALVVWRAQGAIAILNKYPYNPGHLLVAPASHVPGFEDLDDDQSLELMRAVRRSIKVLRAELSPEGFNIGVNAGLAGGAGIPDHTHMHIVPRWNGDTNFMPILGEVKVVNEHLSRTAEKLREAFATSS